MPLALRNSIAFKATIGIGAIVVAAIIGMITTYIVSANAIEAIQESQDISQAMLTATTTMEVDTVSAGLRVFQYLESGDPYYRQTYQEHIDRFGQYAARLLALARFDEWKEIGQTITDNYKALDKLSVSIMQTQDRIAKDIVPAYEQLPQLIAVSAKLYDGTAQGSPSYALGRKVEAHLSEMYLSLFDFLLRDRGNNKIPERINDVRALSTQYRQLPLSQANTVLIADFQRKFDAFAVNMEAIQRATEIKRGELVKALYLQRQIIATINTRIKPALKRHTDEAAQTAATDKRRVFIVAGGVSLLLSVLSLLAGRYVRKSIVAPIQKLEAGADAIAAGDLNHRVVIETGDEYADLARHFNHMIDELKSTTVSKTLLQEKETQLRTLLDGVNDYAIFSVDNHGNVTQWNAASTRILGYETQDMEGVSFGRLFNDTEQARLAREEGLTAVAPTSRFETDTSLIRKNGEVFEANIVVTPLGADDGGIEGYSVVVRDITERVKAERHIEALATRDGLTGLSNRSMLMEQMTAAIARAARSHTQLVVMFVDLDKFKAVNDMLGHAAGDDLLRECAKRLLDCIRTGDIVARLGGDEFVVLLTDVADKAIVSPIADRMLELLATPYHLRGHDAQTSASIGICAYPADGGDAATLMKNADMAMYHAKEQNRNNYQFYAEEMNQRMIQRAQLERELRAALINDEFVLHYQPQVNVISEEISGVESLIRWQHPTRGLLLPGDFITLAEETGLVIPIGEWVLNHACCTIKAWRENGVNIPYVGVNVSAAQLNENLVGLVRQALVSHGIEPGWLMLEITETMLMERVDEAIAIFQRIRDLGVRIGMDDFGTGYSSLSVLQRLPLDTLKIDRSFVRAIDDETDNARAVVIIGAIIAIAKELDLAVVAEGVETPTQLAFLRTLNCDTYQGYLFSQPVDTIALQARFTSPAHSALHGTSAHARTITSKIMLELPTDVARPN
jgi:diguanylate cyclase (GGDEF)-like protein/PAS domain S-box-containing protein